MINVRNVGERVKAQFRAIEINPAGLVTVVLVAVPHVDNPGESPGIQYVTKNALRQEGFTGPGRAGDGDVKVGTAVLFTKHVVECHLVPVGRQRHPHVGQLTFGDDRHQAHRIP